MPEKKEDQIKIDYTDFETVYTNHLAITRVSNEEAEIIIGQLGIDGKNAKVGPFSANRIIRIFNVTAFAADQSFRGIGVDRWRSSIW